MSADGGESGPVELQAGHSEELNDPDRPGFVRADRILTPIIVKYAPDSLLRRRHAIRNLCVALLQSEMSQL